MHGLLSPLDSVQWDTGLLGLFGRLCNRKLLLGLGGTLLPSLLFVPLSGLRLLEVQLGQRLLIYLLAFGLLPTVLTGLALMMIALYLARLRKPAFIACLVLGTNALSLQLAVLGFWLSDLK